MYRSLWATTVGWTPPWFMTLLGVPPRALSQVIVAVPELENHASARRQSRRFEAPLAPQFAILAVWPQGEPSLGRFASRRSLDMPELRPASAPIITRGRQGPHSTMEAEVEAIDPQPLSIAKTANSKAG